MTDGLDLEAIEKKAFSAHLQSGYWEIFIGCVFLAMGLYSMADAGIWIDLLYGLTIGAAILAVTFIRTRFVQPRLGTAVFGPKRKARLSIVTAVIAALAAFGAAIYYLPGREADGSEWAVWIHGHTLGLASGLIIFLFAAVVARLMDHRLFYVVGLICGAGFGGKAVTGEPWILVGAGALVVFIGAYQLFRFLRTYPLPQESAVRESV